MWFLHRVIRRLARVSLWSFFADMYVTGQENVPLDGPVIIVSTHHNMMIDPAVLSCTVPYKRVIHYWAKSTLFANAVARYILLSTGNIPVDRRNRDNQVLFRGTFEALSGDHVVALFPEGTSYTEPRIMQVKDGAAWSALEYARYQRGHPGKRLTLVPAAIVYTNKAKYRSSVVVQYGPPIPLEEMERQFLEGDEAAAKRVVKQLTHEIERRLVDMSINAPDWETLFAARTTRDLLWGSERAIKLPDFIPVSQTLVDLFSTPDLPGLPQLKQKLLAYHSLLKSTKLTHADLAALPLPRELNPNRPDVPLPSRLSTLGLLLRDTLACLVRLPVFIIPLLVHAPAYYMARLGAEMAHDEEETQAQNKVVFGLLFLGLVTYPTLFFVLWALFWLSPAGAIVAAALVWAFALYHVKAIDDQYAHAKRLLATWRVLVGVWMPKRFEVALSNLTQYTTPVLPPANPFLEPRKGPDAPVAVVAQQPPPVAVVAQQPSPTPSDAETDRKLKGRTQKDASTSASQHDEKRPKPKRPPRKRLVRHVLRARIECAKALDALLTHLQREGAHNIRLVASPRLAEVYGREGTRDAREVLGFLKAKGAVFEGLGARDEWGWGALSSADEGGMSPGAGDEEREEVVWVPAGRHDD